MQQTKEDLNIMCLSQIVKFIVSKYLLICVILTCNINLSTAEELTQKTAKQYFLDGMYSYADRSYTTSAEQFEALSKNHPYSQYTKNSLIMEAYTNYLDKEYEKISGIAEVFFRLFPNDEYTAYMMYLLGMSYYVYIQPNDRAIDKIIESKKIFTNLLEKYPTSKFANNVKIKVDYLAKMEQLNDIKTAEYYQRTGKYISAIRRYTGMFAIYKDKLNKEIEEMTLCRIIALCDAINMNDEAVKYLQLLKNKYPNSKCLQK